MKRAKHRNSKVLIICSVTAICLAAAMMFSSVAFARYAVYRESYLTMNCEQTKPQVYICSDEKDGNGDLIAAEDGSYLPAGEWEPDGDGGYFKWFLLTNSMMPKVSKVGAENVMLSVFVSDGLKNADDLTLELFVNGCYYTGRAFKVNGAMLAYEKYGEGYIYKFYADDGEEVKWEMHEDMLTTYEMCITAKGNIDQPIILDLFADAVAI